MRLTIPDIGIVACLVILALVPHGKPVEEPAAVNSVRVYSTSTDPAPLGTGTWNNESSLLPHWH